MKSKLNLLTSIIASKIISASQLSDDIDQNTIFGINPFTDDLPKAEDSNMRFWLQKSDPGDNDNCKSYLEEYTLCTSDETQFNDYHSTHFGKNLGRNFNILSFSDGAPVRNHLKYNDKGSFGFRFLDVFGTEVSKLVHQTIKNEIIPVLRDITHGGIYDGSDNTIYLLTLPYQPEEEFLARAYPKDRYIEYNANTIDEINSNDSKAIQSIWVLMHEFLHIIGFAHPHDNSILYNVINDKYYAVEQGKLPDYFQLNSIMSYSCLENAAINLAHFEYILDQKNSIILTEDTQGILQEFVDKYRSALEIGLTPFDIVNIQTQFVPTEYANEAKNIIEKGVGKALPFLFTFEKEGKVRYMGTGDVISSDELEEYCKGESNGGFITPCKANLSKKFNITLPDDQPIKKFNITLPLPDDQPIPEDGLSTGEKILITLLAVELVLLAAYCYKKKQQRAQHQGPDLEGAGEPSTDTSQHQNVGEINEYRQGPDLEMRRVDELPQHQNLREISMHDLTQINVINPQNIQEDNPNDRQDTPQTSIELTEVIGDVISSVRSNARN